MASITDIKRRILELSPAQFQEFCDILLSKKGYKQIHGYGMKAGTGNTTIGHPDTYFRKDNGKYVFVAYTKQQSNIYNKLRKDIENCLDSSKTGLAIEDIEEIICCHTSSNLSAGNDKKLHDQCESKGIKLTILGIDEIASLIHNCYPSLARNYLGLSIDTNQILSLDDFINEYDANRISAPLNTVFQYRDSERMELTKALEKKSVVVVTGKAGVGKTRLVLETVKSYAFTHGYKLLCVKNNNLGLYEDLVSATEQAGKYLFFIDDANELVGLRQILAYTTKEYLGYTVKVIVTVRDYAKANVVLEIKEFTDPHIIEISSFSDDEIRGFLDKNMDIRNEDYVKQIIRIAEGNARMAYMAGKLAIEYRSLSAIKDVTQLYDAYYKKYVNACFGEDKNLCLAAGILSITKAVILDDLSVLQDVLLKCNINEELFTSIIHHLSKLEAVEIQLNQVASFSDQCLSNYMLYYVFFEKKLIPFADILETGYKHFRNGVIRSVNIVLTHFASKGTKEYCTQEILKVWDKFYKQNDSCYEDFVKDFHCFRPEVAFLLAQQKVDKISKAEISIFNISFANNTYCYEESILEFLSGYQNTDYTDYVMEILLSYCSKNEKTLISGYKWLENYYGINRESYKYQFCTQRRISIFINTAILKGDIVAMSLGLQWAKYALSFIFQPLELGRGRSVILYHFDLIDSEGVREYRHECWSILKTLATMRDWHDKVITALEEYVKNINVCFSRDIIIGDVEDLETILSTIESKKIRFLKIIQRLSFALGKLNIEHSKKWSEKLTGEKWVLFQLLENDSYATDLADEDYNKWRSSQISKYGKTLSEEDIPCFIQTVNAILSDGVSRKDADDIKQGIELIVREFEKDKLYVFLKAFVQFGPNITICPQIVLKPLNESDNPCELLSYLEGLEFPQKSDWLYGFFDTLPSESVSPEILEGFLRFIYRDLDNKPMSSFRNLRVIDKFLCIECNIYPTICSIIYEKRDSNKQIVEVYFEQLFHETLYSPQELCTLFKDDLDLLQDIYFYMLKTGNHIDYTGAFLQEFLPLADTWLEEYSEVFWELSINHKEFIDKRNDVLWKSREFTRYIDYIFYRYLDKDNYSWKKNYAFRNLFGNSGDGFIRIRQQEWLNHIIVDNAFSDHINTIFELVSELNEDVRRNSIKTFLDINPDFDTFKHILYGLYQCDDDSILIASQKEVLFLNSLLPFVSEIQFLKHRAWIKKKIESINTMIKRKEIEEIYMDLYM